MNKTIRHTGVALVLATAGFAATGAEAGTPLPCHISAAANAPVCRLASESVRPEWTNMGAAPLYSEEDGHSFLVLGEKDGTGVSKTIALPLGSTIGPSLPSYKLSFRVMTLAVKGVDSDRVGMRMRLSLTDAGGNHAVVLAEEETRAPLGTWETVTLAVKSLPYAYNAHLKLEFIRGPGKHVGLVLESLDQTSP